jgi:hypothetical protein
VHCVRSVKIKWKERKEEKKSKEVKRNKKCFKEDILSGFMCFWLEGKKMEGNKIMVINEFNFN